MDDFRLVFKFRGLSNLKDIGRTFEILDKKELFVPRYSTLNDPFEGYITSMGHEPKRYKEFIEDVRVLAFSKDCFSQLMWSHYANQYNGICIGFCAFEGTEFSMDLRPVEYLSKPMWTSDLNYEPAFYTKQTEWKYEKEERIVYPNDKRGDFYKFESDEIACIIIGFKVCKELKEYIKKQYSAFPILEVRQKQNEYGLYLYSYRDDTVINSLEELNRYIANKEENK